MGNGLTGCAATARSTTPAIQARPGCALPVSESPFAALLPVHRLQTKQWIAELTRWSHGRTLDHSPIREGEQPANGSSRAP